MGGIYKISTRHLQDLQSKIAMHCNEDHLITTVYKIVKLRHFPFLNSSLFLIHVIATDSQSQTDLCRKKIYVLMKELLSLPEPLLLNVLSLLDWWHLFPVR